MAEVEDRNVQTSPLLHAFPNTALVGVLRRFSTGYSGSRVLAAKFCSTGSGGLDGTYIVKIGTVAWAAQETAFYHEAPISPWTPLLASYKLQSTPLNGLVAVAYEIAFDFDVRPESLRGAVADGSHTLDELQTVLTALAKPLADWYTDPGAPRETVVVDPYTLLRKMLGYRIENLPDKLKHYLPTWNQEAPQINLDGRDSTRLPNPLVFLRPGAWGNRLGGNIRCPIGRIHGDLHGDNVIFRYGAKPDIRVIDFEDSVSDGVPFFDFAYLEFDLIRRMMPPTHADFHAAWLDLLDVSMESIHSDRRPHGWLAERTWHLIRPLRRQVLRIQELDRTDYSIAWWLATVAVGLNFARKGDETRSAFERMAGLIYAAYGLEWLLREFGIRQSSYRHVYSAPWLLDETTAQPGIFAPA